MHAEKAAEAESHSRQVGLAKSKSLLLQL